MKKNKECKHKWDSKTRYLPGYNQETKTWDNPALITKYWHCICSACGKDVAEYKIPYEK